MRAQPSTKTSDAPSPLRIWDDEADRRLSRAAADGDLAALTSLVERHQRWLYNLAIRLVLSPADAEDLAQEAIVRIVTRIATFEGRSSFRTWAYRILKNCFLDGRRRRLEAEITTFAAYGEALDALPLAPFVRRPQGPDVSLLVEEAKVGCMLGMLLCLDRDQRLAYVLGEIFEAPSEFASAIMETTPSAFRKRLQRARHDLTQFMNDKCGLVRAENPCRCDKKTKAFIRAGWVDPGRLKFTAAHLTRLRTDAPQRATALAALTDQRYADLFRQHPIVEGPDWHRRLQDLVQDPEVRQTFGFGPV